MPQPRISILHHASSPAAQGHQSHSTTRVPIRRSSSHPDIHADQEESSTPFVSHLFSRRDKDMDQMGPEDQDDSTSIGRAASSELMGERDDPPNDAFRQVPVRSSTETDGHGSPSEDNQISDNTDTEINPSPPVAPEPSSSLRFQRAAKKAFIVDRLRSKKDDFQALTRAPGIDPRRVDLPDLKAQVVIQAVDCSKEHAEFSVLTNDRLEAFLDRPRPKWGAVRWLHVNGLSWDVIKMLALKYDLHPLAIEDMLHHGTASTRSKSDWYKNHLFTSVVVHKNAGGKNGHGHEEHEQEPEKPGTPFPNILREQLGFFSSPPRGKDPEYTVGGTGHDSSSPDQPPKYRAKSYDSYWSELENAFSSSESQPLLELHELRTLSHNRIGLSHALKLPNRYKRSKDQIDRLAARWTVHSLTKDVKVHVHIEQLSIFVLRKGIVISFTQDAGYHPRFSNIFDRIHSSDDLIRETEDSSFVLQALLDVVADDALDIVDEFREQITSLEARVLASPDMGDVRHLHVLSAQLLLLKSTLSPLLLLLQAVRTQDDAKAMAAGAANFLRESSESVGRQAGFVSREAKVYLGDVMDHVESTLSSLDLFSSLAENLIGYTFNSLSYSSNSYMQALSVLSVIFLPLTFLSGYFGMNFETFPHVLDGGVSYFWKIAIPTAILTTTLFSWSYLVEMVNSLRRDLTRLYHRKAVSRRKFE